MVFYTECQLFFVLFCFYKIHFCSKIKPTASLKAAFPFQLYLGIINS